MSDEYFQKITELNAAEVSFAVATVIKITGSVSAKPGAKSIINDKGETLFGWVGGGCAEEAVREASLESWRACVTEKLVLFLLILMMKYLV